MLAELAADLDATMETMADFRISLILDLVQVCG